MFSIAQPEVALRPPPSRSSALTAAGVLVLAVTGQLALEHARETAARPSLLGPIALIAAAGLAIALFRKNDFLPAPPQPLEPPHFRTALFAACLPGAVLLLVALIVHVGSPSGAGAARLWVLGLVLLALPGVWDWARSLRQRTTPAVRRDETRFAAAAAVLFVFAFALRIWGGIDRMPGWLDSDEAGTGIAGRAALAEGLSGLFGFWEMGNPHLTLFVSQLAALPFGEGLRALRLGSALLGSLTVVLLFDFGRRLVGAPTAFLAALLLSVNHVFLHYSRVGQIYVDTPFFASLVLALLLRVLTGGSFLALTAAGVALGIGAAAYVSSWILPALVLLTLLGWAMTLRWPAKRALPLFLFLAGVAVLIVAPAIATIFRLTPELAYQRVPAISLMRPGGLEVLSDAYQAGSSRDAVVEHVVRTTGVFNFGGDHFKAYGAQRAMNDAVTAALTPVAFLLLFSRLSTPLGWLCIVFTGAYLSGGVLFVAAEPSYHRVLAVLLFSSLAVAWTLVGLARALAAPLGASARRWLPLVTVPAVAVAVGASAWLNLHYYFRKVPQIHRIEAGFGAGRLICRYARTHTVVDATVLAGHDYVPAASLYPDLQCPGAPRIRIEQVAGIWRFPEQTRAPRVALILPTSVETANPGEPSGYRLVRRYVDASIRSPAALSLSVLEFERVGDAAVSGERAR